MGEGESHIDLSKLRIIEGRIYFKIRQQDRVTFVEMSVKDTLSNRMFVSWVQIHD